MSTLFRQLLAALLIALAGAAQAEPAPQVVDIPTRPGVTQRILVLTPPQPRAAVVLLAGGHGGLRITADGAFTWGGGNFLVRSRQRFAEQGLVVAVVDAPSDRQSPPFLLGFRQQPEHAADLKAVIAWLREQAKLPVWLVGNSRGTQSAAYAATELAGRDGPDGIVLTSTILSGRTERPVPEMPLGRLTIPVLVVHHEQDACRYCDFADVPGLMDRLDHAPRRELLAVKGGESRGDPCEAMAYHGFNGIEAEVVRRIADWMLAQ